MPLLKQDSINKKSEYVILIGVSSSKLIKNNLINPQAKVYLTNIGPQSYVLATQDQAGKKRIIITGVSPVSTLYAAYEFCQKLGVSFNIDTDVIPDIPFTDFSSLDNLIEVHEPLFNIRGFHPFHDFPEGPDWWDVDDYKMTISQMLKMRMNFMGLHSYANEPNVWRGLAKDVNEDGTVRKAYYASYNATMNTICRWGYGNKATGNYAYGASQIFEKDDYSSEFMDNVDPESQKQEDFIKMFNQVGKKLNKVFTYSQKMGIKTALSIDGIVPDKEWEGVFTRIKRAYPLDYFWIYSGEGHTWSGLSMDQAKGWLSGYQSAEKTCKRIYPELQLGTNGWVLGPDDDRSFFDKRLPKSWPMAALSRHCGKEQIDEGFRHIESRPKWAIPWLEDDPGMTSPQLWAKRMHRDSNLALKYGCTGFIGIGWRTKILEPTYTAMTQLSWEQENWDAEEFYTDWARRNFGDSGSEAIGKCFSEIDSTLPEPAVWGPGRVIGSMTPEMWIEEYKFVGKLAELRQFVQGKGNQSRYDYWLNTFKYMKSMGKGHNDLEGAYKHLLATVNTKGTMGTIANWENLNLANWQGPKEYKWEPRIFVTTLRTHVEKGEKLKLALRVLDTADPKSVSLYYRNMGQGQFMKISPLQQIRHVYQFQLPQASGDMEYYFDVESSSGARLMYPVTAPEITQTLVMLP
ncbi:MAG: hypothetical protein J7M40_17405 [Planctomycetes bacterium]|nr:hypothetical protein [Planctomycetota bacterium]